MYYLQVKGKSYQTEGFVLAKIDYGEADRLLVIFTLKLGKVRLIAKGIRKLQSRKRGHIEVFNLVKIQAHRGRNLDILTEAEVVDHFPEIRVSLKKISLAYYFMEVVGRIIHDEEPNEDLFKLILDNLNNLKCTVNLKKLRLAFTTDLLTLLGFWPKGVLLNDPDIKLQEVLERELSTVRVGRRLSS